MGISLLALRTHYNGGFVAVDAVPSMTNADDWLVWHFTRIEYLAEIVAAGALACDDDVAERSGSVADPGIKAERRRRMVSAVGYPEGRAVSAHVPWYIAAKSPMLYRVSKNHPPEVLDGLVFFGIRLGDIPGSGMEWVASNANAASALSRFTTDLDSLGSFVDFELLKAQFWYNVPEDLARASRRAAEVLIHKRVPLSAMSVVAARNDSTLIKAREMLTSAGYSSFEYRNATKITY